MRKVLLKLHRWAGVGLGVFILIVAVTGALLVFENDIDRLLNPRLLTVTPSLERLPIQRILEKGHEAFPTEVVTGIALPQKPDHAIQISLKSGLVVGVDPYSGKVLGIRDPEKSLARFIYMLHTRLLAGLTGRRIVGGLTILVLFMALSGLLLWWQRQILRLKRRPSWRRVNFDLHNVVGLYCAPFLVFITLSGIIISLEELMFPLILRLNSSPPPPEVDSVVIQDARRLTPDDAVRIASAALPGAATTWVSVPPPGKAVFEVAKRFPEDPRLKGRSRVMIDQYSGQVLQVLSSREAELGTTVVNLDRAVHTGDIFGAPSRAAAFLVCLMLASQVVTGFLIWWRPSKLAVGESMKPVHLPQERD